jgi:hypothetical protein
MGQSRSIGIRLMRGKIPSERERYILRTSQNSPSTHSGE